MFQTLATENIKCDVTHDDVIIPAHSSIEVSLRVTPRREGELRVTGYLFTTLGCRNHCKFVDLAHFDLDYFEVKVISRLPLLTPEVRMAPSCVARTVRTKDDATTNVEVIDVDFDLYVGQR